MPSELRITASRMVEIAGSHNVPLALLQTERNAHRTRSDSWLSCRARIEREFQSRSRNATSRAANWASTVCDGDLRDVLAEARKQQSLASETISVLQKLYEMANGHFRHGMTTPFTLKAAEVDFVLVSCKAGILLFVRL
jgi:hypothetical protein